MDKNEKQKLSIFCQQTKHNGDIGRIYRGFGNNYGTVNVGYEIMLSNRLILQSHVGIRSYDRSQQESNIGKIDTFKANTGVDQLIIPFDVSLSVIQGKANTLSIGADYQSAHYSTWIDPLSGYHTQENKSSALQAGTYVQEEWRPVEKFTLRFGIRYLHIKNNIDLINGGNPVANDLSWDKLLWSAGLRYSINDKLALFANGGSSFSAPGLKAIGGTILPSDFGINGRNGQLPNSDLKPENGIGMDAGMDCKFPSRFKLSLRGFYTILKDGIVDNVVSRNPSQTQSINTESTSKGGEVEISQRINSTLTWYINGTYLISNIKNQLNADLNNAEIPFSPNFIANIGAALNTSFGFTFVPSFNYNSGFFDAISKTDRQKFTPGIVLNSYVAQRLVKNHVYSIDCFAQLYNISNNTYNLPWQFRNPGFSGMLGLKVKF